MEWFFIVVVGFGAAAAIAGVVALAGRVQELERQVRAGPPTRQWGP